LPINLLTWSSAFFNNITYVAPKVPTLYTALTAGDLATNPAVYGTYTHSFVLEQDQVIDIVLNNLDPGKHPFHLHGHTFQVIWRSPDEAGTFADSNVTTADYPRVPIKRDTVVLHPNGNMVLRFRSDNPGIYIFARINPYLPPQPASHIIHHPFPAQQLDHP
jgi:iron transport multicopper oxidase